MLSKSLRQVRPRPTHSVSHIQKVQALLEQQLETNPEFIESQFVPQGVENSGKRTSIYESAVVLVALSGGKITSSSYNRISKNNEFSVYAKNWAEKTVSKEYFNLLLEYWSNLGAPIVKLGKFQDFIHDNIEKSYYGISPKSFQYKNKSKQNTADIVLIVDGTAAELKSILVEISKLSEKEQVSRATTYQMAELLYQMKKEKKYRFSKFH